MEILIAFHRQDLPPVQPFSIEESPPSLLKNPIHPAVAFRLSGKLVNAQNSAIHCAGPIRIGLSASEAQVDDELPALPDPRPNLGRVFGMQKQNSQTAFGHARLGMVST